MATVKEKLVEDLNEIYNELDSFMDDESILSAPKSLKKINDKLAHIIDMFEGDQLDVTEKGEE